MKFKFLALLVVLALALGALGIAPAMAQAYTTSFTTSITYQNVDTLQADNVQIYFYPDVSSTSPIIINRDPLPAGAGTSVFIGSDAVGLDPGFQGSAIMLADRRLVATLVQVPQSDTVKNRPLSNGFESGSPQILLATVLKNNFDQNSIFSVQNTDTEANTITIEFYDLSATLVDSITQTIEDGASFYVDAGAMTGLGTSFNGSAIVTAERGDGSDGSIVATVMELNIAGTGASAFESVTGGGPLYYMPSALCDAFGGQRSAYAVQNTSLTNPTDVTVTYTGNTGTFTHTQTIQPGAKQSFGACNAPGMTTGFTGSAVVESTSTDVVAIGKVFGTGLSTAFVGAEGGGSELALPYVRWSESQYDTGQRQRTFIAIQNVGSVDIGANELLVNYVDRDGNVVATHTIDTATVVGAKQNSRPTFPGAPAAMDEFGYYTDGFGGSATVVCTTPGCEIVAIARVQSAVPATASAVGEDYNGIIVTP
jgi:hypothetical protein